MRLISCIFLGIIPLLCSGQKSLIETDSIRLERELEDLRMNFVDNTASLLKYTLTKKSLIDSINSAYFKAKYYSTIGDFHLRLHQNDSALLYLDSAANLRLSAGYLYHFATTQEQIANVYYNQGKFNIALPHLYKSLSIKNPSKNPHFLKSLFNDLGRVHYELDNFDSAYYYFDAAKKFYFEDADSSGLAVVYNNIGNLYFQFDYFSLAIESYQICIDINQNLKNEAGKIEALFNTGAVYEWIEQDDSVFKYYNLALDIASKTGNLEYIDDIYLEMARSYASLGLLDSSTTMFNRYIAFRDTLAVHTNQSIVLEYETKFRTKETEKKLLESRLSEQRKRQLIYGLILAFVIGFLMLLIVIRNNKQKRKFGDLELEAKSHEIDNLLKGQEAKSYAALLEGQNAERERIAQDLHDHLGSTLAAVKLHFQTLDEQLDRLKKDSKEQFNKLNEMIEDAVQDVRRISHDLASGKLATIGLRGVLTDLANILNQSDRLKIDFYMDPGIKELSLVIEKEVYAIVQEIVSNALKHAQASRIELQLNRQDNQLNLLYEDDGIGFVVDDSEFKGLGLKNISNRLNRLDGTIKFDSVVGRGTIIIINIPV